MVITQVKTVNPRGYTRMEYVVFPFEAGTLTSSYERTDAPRRSAIAYEYDSRYGTVKEDHRVWRGSRLGQECGGPR